LQEEARRARVIIRTSLTPNLPLALFDKRALTQVLLNLLGNALKFTPASGQIILSTTLNEDNHPLLRIRDTGIGMNATELKEALEPFKSQDKSGTGLGLPLTRALIHANNGEFTISSRLHEGTLVEVKFQQAD
jgi:signal transduction histidine kinase